MLLSEKRPSFDGVRLEIHAVFAHIVYVLEYVFTQIVLEPFLRLSFPSFYPHAAEQIILLGSVLVRHLSL